MKKLHMQERAIEEVKLAIKPFYQKRDITKEEYKEILRKAVQKVTETSDVVFCCCFSYSLPFTTQVNPSTFAYANTFLFSFSSVGNFLNEL